MMKVSNPGVAFGVLVLACAVACGDDDDGRAGSDGGAEAGTAGAPRGGSVGRGGALGSAGVSGSAGTNPSTAGASAQGGTTAEGGQAASPGGATHEAGAPAAPPVGGEAGAPANGPDAGAGGRMSDPGGAPGIGGPGSGGTRANGATGGGGGTQPSIGGSAQGGTTTPVGGSGFEASGAGGAGGAGGEGGAHDAGAGGGPSPPTCGDGVLSPGEFCCTPEWVEERVQRAVELWEENAVGVTGCVPPAQEGLFQACGSAACANDAVGCGTQVTSATFEYTPARRQVDGLMDVVVRGQAALLVFSCNFVASMNDLRFRADVLTEVTPEQLTIGIAEPETALDVAVQGCASINAEIANAARSNAEAWIRDQLVQQLTVTDACPY